MPASAVPLPLVCEVTSEEVPTISIRLEDRTPTALRGVLIQDDKQLGIFMSSKPKKTRQPHGPSSPRTPLIQELSLFENDLCGTRTSESPTPGRQSSDFCWVGQCALWRTESPLPIENF